MPKPDQKITFKNPGIDVGDSEDGDIIEAVVELRVEEGGKLCLERINGIPLEGYDKKEPEEEMPDMGSRVMKRAATEGGY